MERRKILIATKTYPSISRKYKETVCTAGVLLDNLEQPLQQIRIYPIRFRFLETDQCYSKWSIISAEIERNINNYREESFRINDESLEIVRAIGTEDNWAERKSLILLLQFSSISEIKSLDKSLGIIKPQIINRYFYKTTERDWSPRQQTIQDQLDLFEPSVMGIVRTIKDSQNTLIYLRLPVQLMSDFALVPGAVNGTVNRLKSFVFPKALSMFLKFTQVIHLVKQIGYLLIKKRLINHQKKLQKLLALVMFYYCVRRRTGIDAIGQRLLIHQRSQQSFL